LKDGPVNDELGYRFDRKLGRRCEHHDGPHGQAKKQTELNATYYGVPSTDMAVKDRVEPGEYDGLQQDCKVNAPIATYSS